MKRGKERVTDVVTQARVLLLDIEGTTTSISFVKVSLALPWRRHTDVGLYWY